MYGNVFVVVPATFSTYPINLEVCPCQVTVTRRYGHMMTSLNGNISALLALYAGNSPVTGEFPSQRPVTRSFDVFFDLRFE